MASKAGKAAEKTKVIVVRGARAVGRGTVAAHKQMGLGYIVAGAGLMLLANSDFIKNSALAKTSWWMVPIGLLVIGMILRKRGSRYAPAFLVAGSMLLVQAWQAQPKAGAGTKPATDATKGPVEMSANGVRYRMDAGGNIEILGDTGSANTNDVASSMADAVYGRRRAA